MRIKNLLVGQSLRTQLNIYMIALLVALTVVGFTLVYRGVMDILREQSEESAVMMLEQVNTSIQALQDEVFMASNLIVLDTQVKRFFESQTLTEWERVRLEVELREMLVDVLSISPRIWAVYIIDRDGKIISVGRDSATRERLLDPARASIVNSMYETAVKEFPQLGWIGYQSDSGGYLSAVRGIRSYFQDTQIGTLVLDIRNSTWADIYNLSSMQDQVYILDHNGVVVSHRDESRIGQSSDLMAYVDKQKKFGSFAHPDQPAAQQIVYYAMEVPDWHLIREVSLTEVTDDVLALRRIIIVVLLLSILVSVGVATFFIRSVTRPIKELTRAMKDVQKGDIGRMIVMEEKNELGVLRRGFNSMSGSIEELMNRNSQIEKEKRIIEVKALQSQISPHFLYNTLNNIKWMAIMVNNTHIADSITSLGKLLKPVFGSTDIMVTVEEEIQYTENYLNLINQRFGEGIKVQFYVEPEVKTYLTLRFILQPLVENACFHGLKARNYIGNIEVSANKVEEQIVITVTDDGNGVTDERLGDIRAALKQAAAYTKTEGDKTGIGLSNIHRRIRLHFGEPFGLDIHCANSSGTTVTLHLPIIRDTDKLPTH